jgi:hypothetical protein
MGTSRAPQKRQTKEESRIGLGVSLFLIAAGAILIWGVTGETAGLDVDAIGVILMIVAGVPLSLLFWSGWGGPAYGRRRETIVEDRPPPPA